jgi:hypothetical protein
MIYLLATKIILSFSLALTNDGEKKQAEMCNYNQLKYKHESGRKKTKC